MLTNNSAPPNTPPEYVDDLKAVNFLRSKKFFVTFTAVLMLLGFYGVSVFILFLTAPVPGITAAFVTIFVETIKIFAIVISAYLGLQAAIDFKYNGDSSTAFKGEVSHSREEIQETTVLFYADKYKDDESYAPANWIEKQAHE
jgi:uncharacterized membrane protein